MKTNYHLRLPAMGAAALLAAALLCASASAAVTFHEYMTVTGSDANKGVHADTGYTPGSGTIVRAKYSMNGAQNMTLFCARSGVTAGQYVLFCQVSGKARWDFDTQAGQTLGTKTVATTTATTYEIEVRNGILKMRQNGENFETLTPTTVGNSFTAAARMILLQSYGYTAGTTPDSNPGWGNSFRGRFHYLAIFEVENGAEVLKHCFVPCVEDGTVKLYDLVEERTVALAATSGGGVNVTGAPEGLDPDVPVDSAGVLDVGSSIAGFGSPSPACGKLSGLKAGDVLAVSCGATPVTNATETAEYICTGWKLYDFSGNVVSNGSETSFAYVHSPLAFYRRLEWQWQMERRLRYVVNIGDVAPCYTNVSIAFSCADPSGDQGGGYFSPGAQLTLSIADPDGRFSDWYGVLPAGIDATATSVTWTVAADAEISPRLDGWVFPDRAAGITSWYVDFASGSNANDGHSWSTPLADFSNVLARARADYMTTQRKQYVFVPSKPGVTQTIPKTYSLSTTDQTISYFTLNFPCVIQGTGRREDVRLGLSRYPSSTGSLKAGIFKIAHAEAAMRNLTLTGMTACKYTYPLRITAGAFDNCIFTKNTNGDYDMLDGSIVLSGSGVITNCLVADNTMRTTTYAAYTSGIYMSGGLVTHSTICSNKCQNKTLGGGVYMVGGTLRNSLIYANEAIQNASGVYTVPAANCLIENCTIADNMTKAGTAYTVYGLRATGSTAAKKTTVRNTIVYGNSGNTAGSENTMNLYRNSATYVELYNNLSTTAFEDSATTSGNVIGDPRFTDAAARDYTIGFSAAVDAGQAQDWMATGTDLAFGPRVRGAAVDIGAYEYIPSAELDASCTVATLLPASGASTRLSAVATGGTAPYSYRWLVDGAVIAEGADKATYDYVFPGGNHIVSLVVTDAAGASVVREGGGVVTVYVPATYVATDGSDTEPYDTPAKAARSLPDALNLTAAGGTVTILPGNYALASQILFSRANITVRSTDGPGNTVFDVAPGVSAANLAASGAVLDGITLQGFNTTAVAFMASGGIVTNCVIRRGTGRAVNFGNSGTIAGCTIEGVTNAAEVIYVATKQAGSGSVLFDHCRITDNRTTGNYCYVLYIHNQGFTLRNCLFARNRADKSPPIRLHTSQITGSRVFESCTFADNVGTGWMSIENSTAVITFRNNVWVGNKTTAGVLAPIGSGCALTASNCVVDGENHTAGTYTNVTTTDDPGLKRDYSPRSGSPCIDKGLHQSWMDTALDLSGNPRILYKAVDIGAFERRQTGTIIQLR